MSSAYVDDRGVFTDPPSTSWWQMYRWRMRHYFYLHVLYFILLGLLGGWSVYIIENYLVPNQFMTFATSTPGLLPRRVPTAVV